MRLTWKTGLVLLIASSAIFAACGALKTRKPLATNTDYDELLVGRLDADYVGMDSCLSACHYHDKIRQDLDNSTMGAQVGGEGSVTTHLVDCESCHGPGSLAIEGLTPDYVAEQADMGIDVACKYETLTPIGELPPKAKDLMCLKCHAGNANANLHDWAASTHSAQDVTCMDCHPIHIGPDLLVPARQQSEMCYGCHEDFAAKMAMPSRHAILERKMACTSCHEPHGVRGGSFQLVEKTVKDTCTKCHADKRGPFAYGHADLTENCSECHDPHGSPNDKMLVTREPFLCLQCHTGHFLDGASTDASREMRGAFYTRCTDCHSSTHGTNMPSPSGQGTFIR